MPMETQQWVKRDIEGPIFLVKRNTHPRFQLVVLNKTQAGIFTEDIHAGLDFEVNPPYLMYTHGEHEITGMWFYSAADLTTMAGVLQRIQASLPRPEEPEPQAHIPVTAAPVDSSASDSNNDSDFWDKARPAAVSRAPAPQEPVHPAQQHPLVHPNNSNFKDLLKQAQAKNINAKQQQQQKEATNAITNLFASAIDITPSPVAAAAADQPTLLPPRFFEAAALPSVKPPQPQQNHAAQEQTIIPVRHNQNQASRVAPSPSATTHPATPAAAALTQDTASTAGAAPVNSLARHFGKNVASATMQPPAAAASPATPSSNRTAHHHNNTTPAPERAVQAQTVGNHNHHHGSSSNAVSQGASTAAAAGTQRSHASVSTEGLVMRAQIRQAVAQLLSNDVFVDMVGEALQGVGLLQRK
ncbi:MAG: hypothetical protein WDW38_009470 [Sanguina aurantia]